MVIGCVRQESISRSSCIELFALFHHAGFNMFQSIYIVFWFILILGTSSRKQDERAKTVSQSCKTWYGYCGRYLHYNGISWLSILPECVQRKHHVKLAWNTVRTHRKSRISYRKVWRHMRKNEHKYIAVFLKFLQFKAKVIP